MRRTIPTSRRSAVHLDIKRRVVSVVTTEGRGPKVAYLTMRLRMVMTTYVSGALNLPEAHIRFSSSLENCCQYNIQVSRAGFLLRDWKKRATRYEGMIDTLIKYYLRSGMRHRAKGTRGLQMSRWRFLMY